MVRLLQEKNALQEVIDKLAANYRADWISPESHATLLQQLNEAQAGAAAMRERLFAIIEVAEFIDDDTKHQSRAIDEVLKHDCGRDFLTRLQKAEAERDSAREKLLKCQRAMDTFCQRRERGEIKSTATYEQFRKILAETL